MGEIRFSCGRGWILRYGLRKRPIKNIDLDRLQRDMRLMVRF